MKVSDEMVERAARALWMRATSDPWDGASEKFREHYLKDARAALEAALHGCATAEWRPRDEGAEITMWCSDSSLGRKRVALVPLDD